MQKRIRKDQVYKFQTFVRTPAAAFLLHQCGESTNWPCTRSLLLVLAPHKVGFFRNLYSYQMEFVQIKRRVRGKSSSFWWCKRYSAIWSNSREHTKNVFAVNLGYRDNKYEFWWKHSPNVLENQTKLQNNAYTARNGLNFRVLCALFEQIPSGINRDIL